MKSQPVIKQKNAATRGNGKYRVVIADENCLSRKGLRDLLYEDGRFEVVAEASNGEGALKAIMEYKLDVAILDATLPDISGLEVAGLLKAKNKPTPLVILAAQKDEKLFNQSISLGIKGFVLKKNSAREILDCIAAVATGEVYVSSVLTDFLLRRRNNIEVLSRRKPGLGNLTASERRILKRIAQGKTSREIAVECGVSPRTVDSHRAHICEKLGLRGSNRLLQFALEHRDALSHLDSPQQ
ncbi:MAG TPA: response regulator transcription factor [Candidatus Polarisedimenticolia bacterium]|nr:response regulator transcription factor [Candidatus Polarisedimenticolia bacterium]